MRPTLQTDRGSRAHDGDCVERTPLRRRRRQIAPRDCHFHAPGGLGVRFDSALYAGYVIPPYYDSLAGKLIVHGRDRAEAVARMRRALGELVVGGIETTTPLFLDLLAEPDIQIGRYHIHWLEQWIKAQG